MSSSNILSKREMKIFAAIEHNDVQLLKELLAKGAKVDIYDKALLTPLQVACALGNKQIVEILIDKGANVNMCKDERGYTPLHFAGISGNVHVCHLLLLAGADTQTCNSKGHTPAEIAVVAKNYSFVTFINNYIPKSALDQFTAVYHSKTIPSLPPFIADAFHKFVTQVNIHPINSALVLRQAGISKHLEEVKNVLGYMCAREIKRGVERNDVKAFKLHCRAYVVGHIMKLIKNQSKSNKEDTTKEKQFDFVEALVRELLITNERGQLENMENFMQDCIRKFPARKCAIIRQIVSALKSKDSSSALIIINEVINGKRESNDTVTMCHACGEETPAKICSKCNVVQYCNAECQRLHWPFHKKICVRAELSEMLENVNLLDLH